MPQKNGVLSLTPHRDLHLYWLIRQGQALRLLHLALEKSASYSIGANWLRVDLKSWEPLQHNIPLLMNSFLNFQKWET
jgi:hypothetical protein